MAVFDNARTINMAGNDEIINNSRMRASYVPLTVRSITFPANPIGTNWIVGTGAPISITSGVAIPLDTGQLLSTIVVLKPTASVNLTFDTAAQIVAGVNQITAGAAVGDIITTLIINGASAFTLAPQAAGGLTFDANQSNTTIAANTSRLMYFRLTNVTPGSEAVVAYW
jgi:hypothetical protein